MESQDNSFDQELRQMFQNYYQNTRQQHLNGKGVGSNVGGHVKHHSQMDNETANNHNNKNKFDSLERKQSFTSAKTTALTRYQSQAHVNKQPIGSGTTNLLIKKHQTFLNRKDSNNSNSSGTHFGDHSSRRLTQYQSQIQRLSSNIHSNAQLSTLQYQTSTTGIIQPNKKCNVQSQSSGRDQYQQQTQNNRKKKTFTVDFQNQHLHQIPSQCEIQNILNLKQVSKGAPLELILDNNNIQSIVKSCTQFPPMMRILRLKNNNLTFIGGIGMDIAPRLKVLDLSNNKLISLDFAKQVGRLIQLNLSNNYIQDEQLGLLCNLQKLKILDLSQNQIRDSVSIGRLLSYLLDLRSLNLAQNQLTETLRIDASLVKLKELFLQENKLQNFIISSELQNLKTLNLSQNNLQIFKGLDKYCNESFEYFDISHNELTYLSGVKDNYNSINGLHELKVLNANSNTIKQFQLNEGQEEKLSLTNLTEILMRDNKLKQYKFLNNIASKKLKMIDLGGNQIWRIEPIFDNLKSIEVLYLDKNIIENLMNLGYYINLRQLVLDNNKIEQNFNNLQHIFNLKHLEILTLNLDPIYSKQLLKDQLMAELPNLKLFDNVEMLITLQSSNCKNMAKSILIPKSLSQINQVNAGSALELTLSHQGNFKEIRNIDLEDSKEQNDIFNELIRISHRQSVTHSQNEEMISNPCQQSSSHSLGLTKEGSDQNLIFGRQSDKLSSADNNLNYPTTTTNTDYDNQSIMRQSKTKDFINFQKQDYKTNNPQLYHHQSQPLLLQSSKNQQLFVKPQIFEVKGLETTVKEGTHQIFSGEMQMILNTDLNYPQHATFDKNHKQTTVQSEMDDMYETRCTPKVISSKDISNTNNISKPYQTTTSQGTKLYTMNTDKSQQNLQFLQQQQDSKAQQLLKIINIEKIQNEVYMIGSSMIKNTHFYDPNQQALFDEVTELITEKFKQTLYDVKSKIISQQYIDTQEEKLQIQDNNVNNNTLDLTQYNSNASNNIVKPLIKNKIDYFPLLRSQLSELITVLHLSYKQQQILTTSQNKYSNNQQSTTQISRYLKDICQHGLGLKNLTNFQLGTYLFQRKEEIQYLESEILHKNNPEALLQSQILQDLFINELSAVQDTIDIGKIRESIMLFVQQLKNQGEQLYSMDSLEQIPHNGINLVTNQGNNKGKENNRYINDGQQLPPDSLININEISEIKSHNEQVAIADKKEISPMAYLKQSRKMRQKSCYDNKENKIRKDNTQISQSQFNTVTILQSENDKGVQQQQQRSNSQQQQYQKIFSKVTLLDFEKEKLNNQASYETTSTQYNTNMYNNSTNTPLSSQPQLFNNNNNGALATNGNKAHKYQKALNQLTSYAKHPLQQITSQQVNLTFINDLQIGSNKNTQQQYQHEQNSQQQVFEGKLIKYLLKSSSLIKARKIYKAYNYENVMALESQLASQSEKLELMFGLIPKQYAKEVFELQDPKYLNNQSLSTNINNLVVNKSQVNQSYLMMFLTGFNNIYEEKNQNRRLNEEVIRQMGKDAMKTQNDMVICLNPSKCIAVYLLEITLR